MNLEMPTNIFRDIHVESKSKGVTGILLKNIQGAYFNGVTSRGVQPTIVDEHGRDNVFRRVRRLK